MTADLYGRLGVPRDATAKQIRKAYRAKAMKAHPDSGINFFTFTT